MLHNKTNSSETSIVPLANNAVLFDTTIFLQTLHQLDFNAQCTMLIHSNLLKSACQLKQHALIKQCLLAVRKENRMQLLLASEPGEKPNFHSNLLCLAIEEKDTETLNILQVILYNAEFENLLRQSVVQGQVAYHFAEEHCPQTFMQQLRQPLTLFTDISSEKSAYTYCRQFIQPKKLPFNPFNESTLKPQSPYSPKS